MEYDNMMEITTAPNVIYDYTVKKAKYREL
jgi:hypothetical protein